MFSLAPAFLSLYFFRFLLLSCSTCILRMDRDVSKRESKSEVLLPHYKLGKTVGLGSFGKVKLAQHVLTGKKVAVKILELGKLEDTDKKRVKREIQVLSSFSHPHIVRLYEAIEIESKIYIVMEYMNRGELFDYLVEKGRLDETEARYIFQQIISGIEFCHLNMVVHRDLKPENLLLDSKRTVKIADFGLSNVMKDGYFLKTSCGSPNYAAPEVISGQPYSGPEVDIWSCGVILYSLICGSLPFDVDSLPILFQTIKSGIYTLPGRLSPGAKDLISRILIVNPTERITIPEIRQHPWFQDHIPRHLAVPASATMKREKKVEVDEEILQEVIAIGFNHDHVMESLRNRMRNEATVTYHLLLDKCYRLSNSYLQSGFQEESHQGPSCLQQSEGTSLVTRNNIQPPFYMNNQGISSTIHTRNERSWTVGIQLYKASEGRYLLDLQRLNGPPILFLEFCAKFLTELRVF